MFFPFQYSPQNLDPSYKMDLDFRGCFGKKNKTILEINEYDINPQTIKCPGVLNMFNCHAEIQLH